MLRIVEATSDAYHLVDVMIDTFSTVTSRKNLFGAPCLIEEQVIGTRRGAW